MRIHALFHMIRLAKLCCSAARPIVGAGRVRAGTYRESQALILRRMDFCLEYLTVTEADDAEQTKIADHYNPELTQKISQMTSFFCDC